MKTETYTIYYHKSLKLNADETSDHYTLPNGCHVKCVSTLDERMKNTIFVAGGCVLGNLSKEKQIAEFVELFGTEQAMGFLFQCVENGSYYTPYDFALLPRTVSESMTTITTMNGGLDDERCTNHARHINRTLPGRVMMYGFQNVDNPTSKVAREKIHPGGHDFAIVDGRYIVDSWLHLMRGQEKWIFDLHDEKDYLLALDIYGPMNNWKHFK